MKKKICYLICMLMIMCLTVMFGACSDSTATDTAAEPESSSEETEFNDLNEFTAVTSADEKITQDYFKDYDATIVNIWATFCPPCLEEMPQIAEIDAISKAVGSQHLGLQQIVDGNGHCEHKGHGASQS